MRKHNYFRSGVAVALAVSMLGSQVAASEISVSTLTDSGGAGTQSAADVFSDGTGSETEETVFGSAEEGGLFSDGTEALDETEVLDSSYKEEETVPLSVTSVLTVKEAQELLNTYEVHAEWTIQNAQEQAVSLALGLDRLTYAALPEALMADSENICRIPAGEDTTIPMTLEDDPQDENRVLLTWEQKGDGQITADFTFSAQAAEADGLSTVKALWYDANAKAWTEAAKADLTWTKIPATTPAAEENPETPEEGQTPPAEDPESTPAEEKTESTEIPAQQPEESEPTSAEENPETPGEGQTPSVENPESTQAEEKAESTETPAQQPEEAQPTPTEEAKPTQEADSSDGSEAEDPIYKEEEIANLSVTSVLTVEEAQNLINTYEVHAEWLIENAQDQTVSLALGMDKLTYAALPEALMADSENICSIPVGEDTTIPMTLEDDPQDTERVLLTWEQKGDGQITADFTVSAQEAEADGLSTIKALWYDTNTKDWTEAAKADLTWTKTPADTPTAEENPETPEEGQTPPAENQDPTQSEEKTEPTETPAQQPGEEEPTPSEEVKPSEPEKTEPTETPAQQPGEEEPTPGEEVKPSEPEKTEPTETPAQQPGEEEPTPSEEVKPSEAEETETPAQPEESAPTEDPELPQEEEIVPPEESVEQEDQDSFEIEENTVQQEVVDGATMPADASAQGSFLNSITSMEFYESVNGAWVKVENGNFADENAGDQVNGIKASIAYTLQTGTLHTGPGYTIADRSVKFKLSDLQMYSVANQSGIVYDGSEAVGSYSINKDTGEVVIVFDEEFAENNAEAPIYGTLSFESKWKTDQTEEDGSIKIKYNGNAEIIVWPDGVPGDVAAQKSKKDFNYDTGEVIYELKVTSNKGTSTNVKLTDTLVGFISETALTVENVTDQNGNVLSGADTVGVGTYQLNSSSTSGLELTLPPMDANSTYTVLVKAQVPADKLSDKTISVDNKLTVTSTNKKQEEISSTGKVEETINNSRVTKTGYADQKDGKLIIRWKIEVNSPKADIAGWELTDNMLGDAKEPKIEPNKGYSLSGNKITFLPVDGKETNNEKYTIEYYTEVAGDVGIGKPLSQTNTVELGKPNGPTQKDEVTVPYNVTWITKSGTYDASASKIDWTININEDGQNIAGASLKDTMFNKLDADKLTIEHADGSVISDSEYEIVRTSDGKVAEIKFNAIADGKNINTYCIKYSTTVTEEEKKGDSATITNEGTLEKPGEGTSSSGEIGVNVSEPDLTKSGNFDSNNKIINWTITLNSKFADLTEKEFKDTFDESKDGNLVSGGSIKIFNSGDQWNAFQYVSIVLDQTVEAGQYNATRKPDGSIEKIAVSDIQGIVACVNDFWKNDQEDKYSECKYEVNYATTVKAYGDSTIVNNSTLGSKTAKAEVPVSVKPDKEFKNVATVTNEEVSADATMTDCNVSEIRRLSWSVKIPILREGMEAGKAFYDYPENGQWFSVTELTNKAPDLTSQIVIGKDNDKVTLTQGVGKDYTLYLTTTAGDGEKTWVSWDEAKNNPETRYYGFKLVFNKAIDGKYFANTLDFNYTTLLDLSIEGVVDVNGNANVKNTVGIVGVDKGGTDSDGTEIKSSFSKAYTGQKNGEGKAQSNGLKWKLDFEVVDTMHGNTITIVDTLPTGISITTKDTITFKLEGAQQSAVMRWKEATEGGLYGNTGIIGSDGTLVPISAIYDGEKITLTIPEAYSGKLPSGDRFSMEYSASEVADDVYTTNGGEIKNTATLSYDNTTKDATDTEHIVKVETTPSYVDKKAILSNIDYADKTYIPYRILINPEAEDLIIGKDTLSMKDTLYFSAGNDNWNFAAELKEETVKLYYGEMLGDSVIKKGEVPNALWGFKETSGRDPSNQGNMLHVIELQIPDETFLILEYTYAIDAKSLKSGQNPTTNLHINNNAVLFGESGQLGYTEDNKEYRIDESKATAQTNKVTFYKIRKGALNDVLSGAEFDFYKWNGASWEFVTNAVSDSDGKLVLTNFAYEDGVPYYFVETKAPEGYILDKSHHHFYISDSVLTFKGVTCGECGNNLKHEQRKRNTKTYIENEIIPQTKVRVKKEWKGSDGKEIPAGKKNVQVQLYRVKGEGQNTERKVKLKTLNADGHPYNQTPVPTEVTDGVYIDLTVTSTDAWADNADFDIAYSNAIGKEQILTALSAEKFDVDGKKYKQIKKVFRVPIVGETTINVKFNNVRDFIYEYGDTVIPIGQEIKTGTAEPYGEPITLDQSNKWSHSWLTLPQYWIDDTENQHPYFYYVMEMDTDLEKYTTVYTYVNPLTGEMETSPTIPVASTLGNFTVSNIKKEETSISVEKKWSDQEDADINSKNWVEMQLFQSTIEQDYTSYFDEKPRSVTLKKKDGDVELITAEVKYNKAYIKILFNWNIEEQRDPQELLSADNGVKCQYVTCTKKDSTGIHYLIYNLLDIPEDGCTLIIDTYPENTGHIIESGVCNDPDVTLEPVTGINGKVVLTASNEWRYSWDNLPKTDADGHELFYYVKEVASSVAGLGYTQKIIQTNDKNITHFEITNVAPPKKQILVKKEWPDGATHEGQNVTVQLYKAKSTLEHKISITYGNQWNIGDGPISLENFSSGSVNVWLNSGTGVSEANLGTFIGADDLNIEFVEILAIPQNADVSQYPKGVLPGSTYVIYNISQIKKSEYSLAYEPKWYGWVGGSGIIVPGLYGSDGSADETMLTPVPDGKIVLNAENEWSHTWYDLQSYSEGDELYYYVKEVDTSEDKYYSPEYIYGTDANGNPTVTVKNNPVNEDVTKVTATKKWEGYTGSDGTEIEPNYDVTLQLFKNGKPVADKIAHLNREAGWTVIWDNLPAKENDKVNFYTVQEMLVVDLDNNRAEVKNYTVEYNDGLLIDGKYVITITNRRNKVEYTSLSVQKEWIRPDTPDNSETVKVSLYKTSQTEALETVTLGPEFKNKTNPEKVSKDDADGFYDETGWKYTWAKLEKLPEGEAYYVVEESVTGYKTTYSLGDGTSGEGGSSGTADSQKTAPKDAASSGNGDVITVTNTKTVDITVKKSWDGYNADDIKTYEVTVILQKYDKTTNQYEDVETVVLKDSETDALMWTHKWSGLDARYTYSVKEIAVNAVTYDEQGNQIKSEPVGNFTTKYSSDGLTWYETSADAKIESIDGTILIQNKKNTQGIILPGTGSKYPLVFYGLGLAFLLVSTVWMLLTLKKRNTLIDAGKGGQGERSKN